MAVTDGREGLHTEKEGRQKLPRLHSLDAITAEGVKPCKQNIYPDARR